MCVIIDKNTMSNVFNRKDSKHPEFKPVLDWILYGKGKIILGGKTYRQEMKSSPDYLRVLTEFSRFGKIPPFDEAAINDFEDKVIRELNNPKCDDPHLIAIVAITKCRIICTNDARSHRFIKRSDLYFGHCKRPKFYSGSANTNLLNNKNLLPQSGDCAELSREVRTSLETVLQRLCQR